MDNLLRPNEVAEILGVTIGALATMRYEGRGPRFIKISAKAVRYRRSDLEAWLEEQSAQSTEEAKAA